MDQIQQRIQQLKQLVANEANLEDQITMLEEIKRLTIQLLNIKRLEIQRKQQENENMQIAINNIVERGGLF